MERNDYKRLINSALKNGKKNPDAETRLAALSELIDKYPSTWLAIDAERIDKMVHLIDDANQVYSKNGLAKGDLDSVVGKHYRSYLSRFDALLIKLNESYKVNEGAKQFENENKPKGKKAPAEKK